MAEALLKHALAAEQPPLNQLKVVSAGVSAFNGDPASLNSIKATQKVGLEISNHRSQSLTQSMIDESFVIFCMTESHRALLEYQFKLTAPHIYLFRELMEPGNSLEIPDPFGMDFPQYEACRDSMLEAVPSILNFLRREFTNA